MRADKAIDGDDDTKSATNVDKTTLYTSAEWWKAEFGGCKQINTVIIMAGATIKNADVKINGVSCGVLSDDKIDNGVYKIDCASKKGSYIEIWKSTNSSDKSFYLGLRNVEVKGTDSSDCKAEPKVNLPSIVAVGKYCGNEKYQQLTISIPACLSYCSQSGDYQGFW